MSMMSYMISYMYDIISSAYDFIYEIICFCYDVIYDVICYLEAALAGSNAAPFRFKCGPVPVRMQPCSIEAQLLLVSYVCLSFP